MTVSENKYIQLSYNLRIENFNGKVVESAGEANPLSFVYGDGTILPRFEQKITGLKIENEFKFSLSPEEAYGLTDENAVIEIPLEAFQIEGKVDYDMIKIGNFVPMRDEHSNKLNGLVINVDAERVKMDFNNPLAGETLYFTGKINHIREAVEEDFEHHHSCSCSGRCDC